MSFYQEPPRLGNQFTDDALMQEYLLRQLPSPVLAAVREPLEQLGHLSGGLLYQLQLADRVSEPRLVQWDAWGHRIDAIEVTRLWHEAAVLAAQYGVVAAAYEPTFAQYARIDQFARAYLFGPSSDVYTCPLAMTDGAARTLLELGNQALIERAVTRLTSRDPAKMWTSGQWMTERTGGSDVGLTETVARREQVGGEERWRLYGTKWFTSATTAQMALALARPESNGPGGRGLALFYLEVRDEKGHYNHIQVNRLKDKLGTRKVPTAELLLQGAIATPVAGLSDGVRNISSMLNITRTWNAAVSTSGMRRALALARDYARRRIAFGGPLSEKPLHKDTLDGMEAEYEGAFLLAFRVVELLGRVEHKLATPDEQQLFRLLTPIAKLTTAKQAVAIASEALEACGGAGYVEDTGLPVLLRDSQVLPIWEGTTNVLALDVLRAAHSSDGFRLLYEEIKAQLATVSDPQLRPCVTAVERALSHITEWLSEHAADPRAIEAGARRLALSFGRTLEQALLASHAEWCLRHDRGPRAAAFARRFVHHGMDLLWSGKEE
jgi:alkylation response protein AidB-like acyl-CoA dehydrogenase